MTEKKVVILSSKDPDETPHDKTSKMGVLCMNAVVISLGILIYALRTESFIRSKP